MKLSIAALGFLTACRAVNFIVIQPDDMKFYEDWSPPPHMPWNNQYPGEDYPNSGQADLPNINALRDNGLEMMAAYTSSPKCGTSRYATVTGRYASRSAYSRHSQPNVNPSDVTIPKTKLQDRNTVTDGKDCTENNLAQLLRNNGYETGMVGKWHLSRTNTLGDSVAGVQAEIIDCGFNHVEAMYPDNIMDSHGWTDGTFSHNMEYVAYKAIEFIENNVNNDFFLYVNPTVPHSPDVVAAMDISCQQTPDGPNPAGVDWSVIGMTAEFGNNCTAYRDDVKSRAGGSTSNEDLGAIWVDDAVGAIMQALERNGLTDDTFVLFQLDHGMVEKNLIWEGGIRIPQFIHYPAAVGSTHREFHGLVSTIDIAPTIADFAGLNSANAVGWYDMDGQSWKTAISDSEEENDWKLDRCLFFESEQNRAVRCGCYKYVELDASSSELDTATVNGWWNTPEAMFHMCDLNGVYKVANDATVSPEITDVTNDSTTMQEIASSLNDLMDCHLTKTNPAIDPVYSECTFESGWTHAPVSSPTTDAPTLAADHIPEVASHWPAPGEHLSGVTTSIVLSVTVMDNDDFNNVRFDVRYPDGTREGFARGTQVTNNEADRYTWEYTIPDVSQRGVYEYRIILNDDAGHSEAYPETSEWIEFLVVDSTSELITAARSYISDVIATGDELAAKIVRMGFHDCVGGCDGCIDMANGDNAGLQTPIDALQPVVDMFALDAFSVTRADIWVLATLVAAYDTQETPTQEFTMDWIGRPTCEMQNDHCYNSGGVQVDCSAVAGPHRELPSPDLTTAELLHFFASEFGFDATDTVAIMGAHTLGRLDVDNSGYNGTAGWVGSRRVLDNAYYNDLIGGTVEGDDFETQMNAGNWTMNFVDNSERDTPDRWQWERAGNNVDNRFVMVNSDIALVRDLENQIDADTGEVANCLFRCKRQQGNGCDKPRCPYAAQTFDIAATFKYDQAAWLVAFESALKDMLTEGADTSSGCATSVPCIIQSTNGRQRRRHALLRG